MSLEQLPTFMAAIRRLESGSYNGNYSALGPVTKTGNRARGAYQIMEQYWADWAAEAGLAGADWRSREAQDAVARHKFIKYYQEFGDWDLVAIAWFGGRGKALAAQQSGLDSVSGYADITGTSIGKYVNLIGSYMETAPVAFRKGFDPEFMSQLLPDDRATLEAARELTQAGADVTIKANVSNPNDYLAAAIGSGGAGEYEAPDPMKGMLSSVVDRFSNMVAGGQRSMVGAPVEPRLIEGEETV